MEIHLHYDADVPQLNCVATGVITRTWYLHGKSKTPLGHLFPLPRYFADKDKDRLRKGRYREGD